MKKTQIRKVNLIFILKYFADALYTPFLVLYLKAQMFSVWETALILGAVPFFSILGNFFFSWICGSASKNRRILQAMVLGQALALFPLPFLQQQFGLTLVLVILLSFLNNPSFNVEDGIASSIAQKENKNYAQTRMFGSMGYFLCLVLFYFAPSSLSYVYFFIPASILYAILSFLWCFVKPEEEANASIKVSVPSLFRNKAFVRYLLVYTIVFSAHTATETYAPAFLAVYGVQRNQWSLLFAGMVFLEMAIIFLLSKRLKQQQAIPLLLLAIGCLGIRQLCYSFPLPREVLIAVSLLRGIGWGLFLASHVLFLKSILPEVALTKSILYLCFFQGIFAAIWNLLAGVILSHFSYFVYFAGLSVCSFIGFLLFFLLSKYFKQSQTNVFSSKLENDTIQLRKKEIE